MYFGFSQLHHQLPLVRTIIASADIYWIYIFYIYIKSAIFTDHSPLFIAFWIHNFSDSPVCTFLKLFYAKIMYYYKELLKAINAILLQLTLLYFFPKKHGFFGNFHEILIWNFYFFPFLLHLVGNIRKICYLNML